MVISPRESSKVSEANSVTIANGASHINAKGRCEDGADDSIASKSLAEKAVTKGIGKIQTIPTTQINMPIMEEDKQPIKFTSTRVWKAPRTILRVASGPLALLNISYLMVHGDPAPEDLLVGRPVLQHLCVETSTLLDINR